MERTIKTATILIFATGLFLSLLGCSERSFDNLSQEIEYKVSEFVENDKSVRNCVLAVVKENGSFSWSGAAGIASQDGQLPMAKDTPFFISSITKLYTATAIMRLYEKGLVSLDDPMSKYLPEGLINRIHVYKGKDYSREITIKELLSHTSGIADYYTEKPKDGKTLFELILEEPERFWTVDETIERARDDLKPNFQPGTDASYSDTNFQLLGMVIEAITGTPLHTVYEDYFFRPLGLKHTWLIGHSKPQTAPFAVPADIFHKDMNITRTRSNGAYWADGGIVSTAEECIIFLKALNEGHLIKNDTLKMMHEWKKLNFPIQYGFGTMYFELPQFMNTIAKMPPLWGHSGSTGSFLYYSADYNFYIAGTINQTSSNLKPFILMRKVINTILSRR